MKNENVKSYLSASKTAANEGTSEGAKKGWESRDGGTGSQDDRRKAEDEEHHPSAGIAKINKSYTRTYGDSGQKTSYVEWTDHNGSKGRTEGDPGNEHMKALISRGEREGVKHQTETW